MSRLALLVFFLLPHCVFLLCAPLEPKPDALNGQLALRERGQPSFIDPRWQAAAKEWGVKAQQTAQGWGSKVGTWSQLGAQNVKSLELGKGLEGLWKASVAVVGNVLPDKKQADAARVHGDSGDQVLEKPLYVYDGGNLATRPAVTSDKAEDSQVVVQEDLTSRLDTPKAAPPSKKVSVPPAKEGLCVQGPGRGKHNAETEKQDSEKLGAESGGLDSAVEAAGQEDPEEPQRHSSRSGKRTSFLPDRGGADPFAPSPHGKDQDEEGTAAASETVSDALAPSVRVVEARSALDFEEWRRKFEKEKHQHSATEIQTLADAGFEQPHVLVLVAGLSSLCAVYFLSRMLFESFRCRDDTRAKQQDQAMAGLETVVSKSGEEEAGGRRSDRDNKDLAQQLGIALGSAVGSLMAEALRLDSMGASVPLNVEELARKLEAVCGSALEAHVTHLPRDVLLAELVRSFSQQYRILRALRTPTSMDSRRFIPSGRPDASEDQTPSSPLASGVFEAREGEAIQSNGAASSRGGDRSAALDWQTQIAEYGSSSESDSSEDRVETTVTSHVVGSEPAENGHTDPFDDEILDERFSAERGDSWQTHRAFVDRESSTLAETKVGVESSPCGPLAGAASESSDSEPSDADVVSSVRTEQHSLTSMNGGGVHERWTFAGSTAQHRKTRRRRGAAELLDVRRLDFDSELGVRHVQRRFSELELAERSVSAREMSNRLKFTELHMQRQRLELESRGLVLQSENNFVLSESNTVQRRSNALHHEKLLANIARVDEKRACELARRCADELVAGLGIMVLCLCWAGYHYGYANLKERLQECSALYKPGQRPFWGRYGPQAALDELAARAQVICCRLAVAGGLGWGLLVGGFMFTMLLRQNVAGSVRVMPSTVLLLILGGACGYAGRGAVERVGGNGWCWLVLWEALCGLHALAIFSTGFVGSVLCPPPGGQPRLSFISPWVAQSAFHATVVVLLPVAAGILPFVSMRDWTSGGAFSSFLSSEEL